MDGYTIFLLICGFLIPAVELAGGAYMLQGGTKRKNDICGYRSMRSMRSVETWRFAHRYCGRLWLIFGGASLGITIGMITGAMLAGRKYLPLWVMLCIVIQVAAIVIPHAPTEKALRTEFDRFGCPITANAVRMSGEHWEPKEKTPAPAPEKPEPAEKTENT